MSLSGNTIKTNSSGDCFIHWQPLVRILFLSFCSSISHGSTQAQGVLLFYTFLATAVFIIGRFIVLPIAQINRLGKIINHEQAAEIIGKHFSEVKDVLLNTLQLHQP